VHPDVDFYTLKPEIIGKWQSKNFRKTQKTTTYWKPKKYWISKYKQMGAQFLHLSCQEGGSHPCTSVSHATVVDLCCILSLYKNRITRIQSFEIAFVARTCNIQCILHQSCPMKTLKLYTNEKFSCLTNNTAQWGPRPNYRLFSNFYWAAQHLLLWAVFAAPVTWDQT